MPFFAFEGSRSFDLLVEPFTFLLGANTNLWDSSFQPKESSCWFCPRIFTWFQVRNDDDFLSNENTWTWIPFCDNRKGFDVIVFASPASKRNWSNLSAPSTGPAFDDFCNFNSILSKSNVFDAFFFAWKFHSSVPVCVFFFSWCVPFLFECVTLFNASNVGRFGCPFSNPL